MKIAVCIKQTADTESVPRLNADSTQVIDEDLTWIINPHDESAIEIALQLAKAHGGTVTLVALGPGRVEKALREGLAMGADAAVHVRCDTMPQDAHVVTHALMPVLRTNQFDLVLTGEVSVDWAGSQIPQRLGVLLGWPSITAVEKLDVDGRQVTAGRPIEGSEEVHTAALPVVVGINRRIGEPRYPSFRGIMKARRKRIDVVEADLLDSRLIVEALRQPEEKAEGQIMTFGPGVAERVASLLRHEVKVV